MSATIRQRSTKTGDVALDDDLAATFTSAAASDRWLRRANPILKGDQPIDCLKRREYDRVRAALEALNTGVHLTP
jgi:hypothetical protein